MICCRLPYALPPAQARCSSHVISLQCPPASVEGWPLPQQSVWRRRSQQAQARAASRRSLPLVCMVVASTAADCASSMHELPDGTQLEVLRHEPAEKSSKGSPLLFLHGSGHAAWCWQERFLPYFAEHGFSSWAVSFRGQGQGRIAEGAKPGTLASNAADIAHFVSTLQAPPIVVAHSFGGLVLQKYLERMAGKGWPKLAGTAFLASAPPSGNQALVQRIMRKMPLRSVRITYGFITKSYRRSASAAKDLFFSEDIPEHDINRYAECFQNNVGAVGLVNLRNLSDELPIEFPKELPPAFVGGGDTDVIVDVPAVEELAAELGVQPTIWHNSAHDVMLDTRWQEVARDLETWLRSL